MEKGTIVVAKYGHNSVLNKPFEHLYDFGYIGGTGKCICYIHGECNMQDSYAFDSSQVREASLEDLSKYYWGR